MSKFTFVSVVGLVSFVLISAPVRAEDVEARYNISLAGFPLGVALLQGQVSQAQYQMKVHAKLVGLANILVGGQGLASSQGLFNANKTKPETYVITSSNGKESRTVNMGLNAGNVGSLHVNPPFDERADRLPLKAEHKRGVVDPVSALMMPVQGGSDPFSPENCNRVLPLFDGLQRFDVVLSYDRTETLKGGPTGYSGNALVCKARYKPIAGYRPDRRETIELVNNKNMEAWLIPVQQTGVLVPHTIAVKTRFGMTKIQMVDFATAAKTKVGQAK